GDTGCFKIKDRLPSRYRRIYRITYNGGNDCGYQSLAFKIVTIEHLRREKGRTNGSLKDGSNTGCQPCHHKNTPLPNTHSQLFAYIGSYSGSNLGSYLLHHSFLPYVPTPPIGHIHCSQLRYQTLLVLPARSVIASNYRIIALSSRFESKEIYDDSCYYYPDGGQDNNKPAKLN